MSSIPAIIDLVCARMGNAVLNASAVAASGRAAELVVRRIVRPELPSVLCLAQSATKPPTPLTREARKMLTALVAELPDPTQARTHAKRQIAASGRPVWIGMLLQAHNRPMLAAPDHRHFLDGHARAAGRVDWRPTTQPVAIEVGRRRRCRQARAGRRGLRRGGAGQRCDRQAVAAGHVVAGSKVDLVHSGVAVAVKAGAAHPDIASEEAVKRAVLAAPTLGYSTGPSGVQLAKLFERWGIAQEIAPRIVTAPPGVPVGALVARGDVALGFQQLSELMSLQGIDVLGPLPPAIQITTTFSAGVCAASTQPDAARALLAFLASPDKAPIKQRHGMEPIA